MPAVNQPCFGGGAQQVEVLLHNGAFVPANLVAVAAAVEVVSQLDVRGVVVAACGVEGKGVVGQRVGLVVAQLGHQLLDVTFCDIQFLFQHSQHHFWREAHFYYGTQTVTHIFCRSSQ